METDVPASEDAMSSRRTSGLAQGEPLPEGLGSSGADAGPSTPVMTPLQRTLHQSLELLDAGRLRAGATKEPKDISVVVSGDDDDDEDLPEIFLAEKGFPYIVYLAQKSRAELNR